MFDGIYEYGLKIGDLPEKEMVKIFEKALSKAACEINDPRIPKRRKMRKSTGPFGASSPGGDPSEYDHIYIYNHRPSNLFLRLYPNQETNGRIEFPEEGVIWILYATISGGYPPKMSEDDRIQEFGEIVMQEIFQTLPGEKVLIRETLFK